MSDVLLAVCGVGLGVIIRLAILYIADHLK